jgi:hypothetical protein
MELMKQLLMTGHNDESKIDSDSPFPRSTTLGKKLLLKKNLKVVINNCIIQVTVNKLDILAIMSSFHSDICCHNHYWMFDKCSPRQDVYWLLSPSEFFFGEYFNNKGFNYCGGIVACY